MSSFKRRRIQKGRPSNLLRQRTVYFNVRQKTIKKATVVITRDHKKSLIERDWLTKRIFRVAEATKMSEYSNSIY